MANPVAQALSVAGLAAHLGRGIGRVTTDAIVGSNKLMHTVIASWCTGCELCIPPCPVDCIALIAVPALPDADLSRERHEARAVRLARDATERAAELESYE